MWVAEFLCFILRETAELLERIGDNEKAVQYRQEYALIAKALNEKCWDGEWYIRGTRDDGGVVGASRNEEGRIFMNAQSWAVISGIASPDRAKQAMDSAYKLLATPRGPTILAPAYTKVDPGVGLATRCVPGKKENGAIFNHVAAWAILGECLLGNGNRAYEYYTNTVPINQAHDRMYTRWSRTSTRNTSPVRRTRPSAKPAIRGSQVPVFGCCETVSTTYSGFAQPTTVS
jgi:cellobiose phosphorylase